jgi:hypothetical protein
MLVRAWLIGFGGSLTARLVPKNYTCLKMRLLRGFRDNSQVAIIGAGNYLKSDRPAENERDIRASVDVTFIENLN